MKVESELIGADSLDAKLKAVTEEVRYKGGRFALRKAAKIIEVAAKNNAQRIDDPNTPNSIADNITTRWSSRRYKRTGDLGFRVGVRGGAKGAAEAVGEITGKGKGNPGGDTFYWRFVEFGTVNAPAHPFMRPALSRNHGAAQAEFVNQCGKAIDRAVKRASKGRQ